MDETMNIEPLPGTSFGAVVTGINLKDLSDATWEGVETAFYEFGALIFPGQGLDAEALPVFAKRFGSLQGVGAKGAGRAASISNRRKDQTLLTEQDATWLTLSYPTRYWHTDGTFNHVMPKVCFLSAASVAEEGGQTAFADMGAAYDALDTLTKGRIADLNAYHSNLVGTTRVHTRENETTLHALVGDTPEDGAYGLGMRAECPLRPLVRIHPVTGRRSLFLGRHSFGIPGIPLEEGDALLREFETEACRPPRVYEHEWQVGDLIVFDNRRLLHRACLYDEQEETRELLNCRVAGDAESDAGLDNEDARRSEEMQKAELARLRARPV